MTISAKRTARFFVPILVALMTAAAWIPRFDAMANERVEAGLKRAAATYATARLLNGIISVAQGTEIAATPAGIGVTLTPGQILEPLNDLVEKFSQVMLMAMVAFGIEKVLLMVGASWAISVILTLIAAAWSVLYLRGTEPRWLARLLLALIITRFAMPVSLMATDMVFKHFLASDYYESQEVLKTAQSEAGKLGTFGEGEKQGVWEKLKSTTVEAFAEASVKLQNLKRAAENAVDRVIRLMAIFVLETIILPILFVWAMFALGRNALIETPTRHAETGRQAGFRPG
ncbi:MAG: hypothetical protein LBD67_09845 [Candidatus Accumulibacter sp.]|jgi:hypothetical protein|nr:hypothetical protein [Accumulibacter sp.]